MNRSLQFGLVALLAGCSGQADDIVLLESWMSPEQSAFLEQSVSAESSHSAMTEGVYVPKTYDELEAEFQARFTLPLSERERALVEEVLAARGMDVSRITIAGRMIVHGDMYTSVDDILAAPSEVVEKGTTHRHDVGAIGGGILPPFSHIVSAAGGTNFIARKPYFGWLYQIKVIVPNTFVRDIVQLAANQIAAAADDCIGNGTFDVITSSDWDQLEDDRTSTHPTAQVNFATISVHYGSVTALCPGAVSPSGCANVPQVVTMAVDGPNFEPRMVPGTRMALSSSWVTGTDPASVSIVTHELLHNLGVAHSFDDINNPLLPDNWTVPGSLDVFAKTSIMRHGGPGTSLTMSQDDKYTLDTLYSPQPGSSCGFPDAYEITCPVVCTRLLPNNIHNDPSIYNIIGQCCWCQETLGHFVRGSTSNPSVFACR